MSVFSLHHRAYYQFEWNCAVATTILPSSISKNMFLGQFYLFLFWDFSESNKMDKLL